MPSMEALYPFLLLTHSLERASSVHVSRCANIKLLDIGYVAFNPNGVVENSG